MSFAYSYYFQSALLSYPHQGGNLIVNMGYNKLGKSYSEPGRRKWTVIISGLRSASADERQGETIILQVNPHRTPVLVAAG